MVISHACQLCIMVEGAGFEPTKAEPSDLQSDPVDRLGTPPKIQEANSALDTGARQE